MKELFHVSGAFDDDIRYQMYIAMPYIREETVHFHPACQGGGVCFLSGISEIPIPLLVSIMAGNVMIVQSLSFGSYLRSVKVCCGATLGSVCLLSMQPAFVIAYNLALQSGIPFQAL